MLDADEPRPELVRTDASQSRRAMRREDADVQRGNGERNMVFLGGDRGVRKHRGAPERERSVMAKKLVRPEQGQKRSAPAGQVAQVAVARNPDASKRGNEILRTEAAWRHPVKVSGANGKGMINQVIREIASSGHAPSLRCADPYPEPHSHACGQLPTYLLSAPHRDGACCGCASPCTHNKRHLDGAARERGGSG